MRQPVLWHQQGEDTNQRMLALATYLGHVKVPNTYWSVKAVRAWWRLNPGPLPELPLLPIRTGHLMTTINAAQRFALALAAATATMASLCDRHASPHTIRHGQPCIRCNRASQSTVSPWFGHGSVTTTHQYIEATLAM